MNIKRIKSDLNTIDEIQKNKENMSDPYMIDVMGYHVQQAIEKMIKYFLNNIYG